MLTSDFCRFVGSGLESEVDGVEDMRPKKESKGKLPTDIRYLSQHCTLLY